MILVAQDVNELHEKILYYLVSSDYREEFEPCHDSDNIAERSFLLAHFGTVVRASRLHNR